MTTCSSCNAPVIWARTTTGRAMPLNATPRAGGNIELWDGVAHVVTPDPSVERYTSHFTDCPNARSHRKPRERAPKPHELAPFRVGERVRCVRAVRGSLELDRVYRVVELRFVLVKVDGVNAYFSYDHFRAEVP